MRRKQNPKRRLTLQSLENRRLFAADVGISPSCSTEIGCKVPAHIGLARPAGIARKVPPLNGLSDIGTNPALIGTTLLPEDLAGSANPGGDDILTDQFGAKMNRLLEPVPSGEGISTDQPRGSESLVPNDVVTDQFGAKMNRLLEPGPGGESISTDQRGSSESPGFVEVATDQFGAKMNRLFDPVPSDGNISTQPGSGSVGPRGDDFFTDNLAGSADPGGDDI